MGIILYPLAQLVNFIFTPIAMLWAIIRADNKDKYFMQVDRAIDIKGNITSQYMFNDCLINNDGYKFGVEGETISYVLSMNRYKNTLTKMGKFWVWILINIFHDPAFKK